MVTKLLAASIAALSLAAPAYADPPRYDCDFFEVADPTREEDWHTGAVVGYVAHAGFVTITCELRVNGVTVAPGWTSSGVGAAVVATQLTFTGSPADGLEICAEATTDHGMYDHCRDISGWRAG